MVIDFAGGDHPNLAANGQGVTSLDLELCSDAPGRRRLTMASTVSQDPLSDSARFR
jgi:hypothetical protein